MILALLLAPGLVVTKTTILGPVHHCHTDAGELHRPHWHLNDAHQSLASIREIQSEDSFELVQIEPTTEHDDNAIFADDDVFGVRRSNAKNEVIDAPVHWLTQCDPAASSLALPPVDVSFWGHPPRGSPGDIPRFLRHLALLI
jgi:hypothetical protein